jgi:pimeloyl-ACP methyl ester carboxylesterase
MKMAQKQPASTVVKTPLGVIEYVSIGQGEPVLFMHGGHSNCHDTLFAKGFDLGRYRLITPSRPGYGKTSLTESNKTPEAAADLIVALMDSIEIGEATVIGISAGGLTAIALAAKHPSRVRRLALISASTMQWCLLGEKEYRIGKRIFAPGIERFTWGLYKLIMSLFPKAMTKMMFRQLSTYSPVSFTPDETRELVDTMSRYRSYSGFANDVDQTIGQDKLGMLRCPTLVLHSEYDNSVGIAHAENANTGIVNTELFLFMNRWGHLLWLGDEYEKPSQALQGWLRKKDDDT